MMSAREKLIWLGLFIFWGLVLFGCAELQTIIDRNDFVEGKGLVPIQRVEVVK